MSINEQKKTKDKAMQRFKSVCEKGDCPTLKEIENSKIRKLAERLRASSDRETLTNISEWHNDNMTYWFERHPLFYYIILSIIAPFVVTFVVGLFFSLSIAFSLSILTLTSYLS
jgi:predicted transglutaminase-like protease